MIYQDFCRCNCMYIIIRTVINIKYFILPHILIHSNSSYLPNKQSSCLFKIFRKDHLLPPVIHTPRPAFQGGNLRSTNIFFTCVSLYNSTYASICPQHRLHISFFPHLVCHTRSKVRIRSIYFDPVFGWGDSYPIYR